MLLVSTITAQAQTPVTTFAATTGDAELLLSTTTLSPAAPDAIWTFAFKEWLPIVQTVIRGRLLCHWNDGHGGVIECPPEAVACAVFANATTAAIGCMDANNRVVGGLGLWRERN